MTDQQKQLLKELRKTNFGRALDAYLAEEMTKIGNIDNCTSWEDTLSRQHALELINRLFYFMQDNKPVEKKKNQYE